MSYGIIAVILGIIIAAVGYMIHKGDSNLLTIAKDKTVSDMEGYSKEIGRALLIMGSGVFLSGVFGFFSATALISLIVLALGVIIPLILLGIIRKKYSN